MKAGKRSLERVPAITSASTYGTEWVEWWTAAQPRERDVQQWPFSRDADGDISWGKFPANGKDGIFLAVMALSWWAPAIRSSNEITTFEEAVTDLHWVIRELIQVKTASQIPPSPLAPSQDKANPSKLPTLRQPSHASRPPLSSSHLPVSTPKVHTHQRAEGKRAVRPSRKALGS